MGLLAALMVNLKVAAHPKFAEARDACVCPTEQGVGHVLETAISRLA